MKVRIKCVAVTAALLVLVCPFAAVGFDLSGTISLYGEEAESQPVTGARIAAVTYDDAAAGCPVDIPSEETVSDGNGTFTLSDLPDNTVVQLRVEGTPATDTAYGEFVTIHLPFIDWSTLPEWMRDDFRELTALRKNFVDSVLDDIDALDLPDVDREKGIVVGSIASDECPDIPVGAAIKIPDYVTGATIIYQDADGSWNPNRTALAGSDIPFIIYNIDMSVCDFMDMMVWAEKEGSSYSSYNKVRVYPYEEGAARHITTANMLVLDACDPVPDGDDGDDDGGGGGGCFISSMIH